VSGSPGIGAGACAGANAERAKRKTPERITYADVRTIDAIFLDALQLVIADSWVVTDKTPCRQSRALGLMTIFNVRGNARHVTATSKSSHARDRRGALALPSS
jgi:hypothetical protein